MNAILCAIAGGGVGLAKNPQPPQERKPAGQFIFYFLPVD
jgi:hypothetical protein